MLSLTQLTVFAAVARTRSITKAAQALRISQPSVSKHVKNLETHYGIKLFERDGRALELTDEGRLFQQRVSSIISQLEELEQEFNHASTPDPEPLKVAGSYAASALLLPSVLADFQKRHPTVRIILRTGSTNNVKAMLLNSEVEIALLNEKPANPQLAGDFYRDEKLVVFAAPGHPLARKKHLTSMALNNALLVATGGKGRLSTTEKILKRSIGHGVKAKIGIRCATPEAVKAIVKTEIAAGILFEDSVLPEIRKNAFKLLRFSGLEMIGRSYVVYYKDRLLSPQAADFLKLLYDRKRM
jgi:LysR family transcriptional regulator, transcriptional activator of the cysJI operon